MAAGASVACAMCGTVFDPAVTSACASCPLGANCSLACCPACGYSSVDVGGSRLARLATRMAGTVAAPFRRNIALEPTGTLADAVGGDGVRIEKLDDLPPWQERRLAAYGIAPGRRVHVVQTSPVVVVRVDHSEVAFERRLARGIHVTRPGEGPDMGDVPAVRSAGGRVRPR